MKGLSSRTTLRRARRTGAVLTAAIGALGLVAGAAATASATRGSVPHEVVAYLADGLVDQLSDLYGTDAAGGGIDFDESTTASAATRVFAFTADYLASIETEYPIRRLNEWVTIVAVKEEVVGVAVVVIPEGRQVAELSLFVREPALAAALPELADDAALVRDDLHGAWHFVEDTTLTAIVPGTSGLVGAISLAGYAEALSYPQAVVPPSAEFEPGVLLAAGTLAIGLAIVTLFLVVARRTRPTSPSDSDSEPEPEPESEPELEPEPEPESEPEPKAKAKAKAKAQPKPESGSDPVPLSEPQPKPRAKVAAKKSSPTTEAHEPEPDPTAESPATSPTVKRDA